MHEVKLPQLGQSVEEASIVTWYKAVGDTVVEGEPLFSVQTDKAEIECEAPASGVLRKIVIEPDVVVPVLTVVAFVGDADEPIPEVAAAPAAETAAAPAKQRAVAAPVPSARRTPTAVLDRPAASPRASATAASLGISLAGLAGTGPNGRIIEADVVAAAQGGNGHALAPARVEVASNLPGTLQPLSAMRQTVGKRLSASKSSAPHFYLTMSADMTACKKRRETTKGFKPTYNDFVLAACVEALGRFPSVNAQWTPNGVYEFGVINLGMAVALDAGLIVPVIHNVGGMDLESIHNAAAELVEKAHANKLKPDEYAGATFTVSNLGPYGVDEFTAIINPPGSAILAAGQMKDQPVVIDGKVQIRPMLRMTLSSDHRVIDGALAAQFLGAIKTALESAAFED